MRLRPVNLATYCISRLFCWKLEVLLAHSATSLLFLKTTKSKLLLSQLILVPLRLDEILISILNLGRYDLTKGTDEPAKPVRCIIKAVLQRSRPIHESGKLKPSPSVVQPDQQSEARSEIQSSTCNHDPFMQNTTRHQTNLPILIPLGTVWGRYSWWMLCQFVASRLYFAASHLLRTTNEDPPSNHVFNITVRILTTQTNKIYFIAHAYLPYIPHWCF
jgi:hypothetical protein